MTKTYRETFFDQGFITNIKVFNKNYAQIACDDYLNFINKNKNRQLTFEAKLKPIYFFHGQIKLYLKKILDIVENIIGKNIVCWNSLIFHKKPNTSNFVSMHQDQNYWNIEMNKGLTVSLALTDSNVENGCLRILPYSHKKSYEHIDLHDKSNMLARGQTIDFKNDKVSSQILNIELEQGECCIFHGNIAHGSLKNNSKFHRILYAMRFLTPDNKINTSLYYNYATLVRGENNFNNFFNEPSLKNNHISDLRKLHKEITISQFAKYLKLKIKFNFLVNFFMFFFKINF